MTTPIDHWLDRRSFVCWTCIYYVPKDEQLGRCRRHAPTVSLGWPAVYTTDWCGDHKLAIGLPLQKADAPSEPAAPKDGRRKRRTEPETS